MERMYAPWRLAFIEGRKVEDEVPRGPTGCIFCDFPRPWRAPPGEDDAAHDRTRLVVHVREHAFVILNKFPYNNGHVMVVPRVHQSLVDELPQPVFDGLQALLRDTIKAVRTAYSPDGMNVGMNLGKSAGAGIAEHLHWHVVPRWQGDMNFMPVIADVKVISEGLQDTFDRLKKILG